MWIIFKNIFSNFWDAPSWNRGRPDLTHGCHGCHGSSPFQQIHQSPICTIKHHNRSSASRGAATEKRHAMCHGPKMGLLMITMDIYGLLWGISYNEYVIKLPFTWLVEQLVGRRATQRSASEALMMPLISWKLNGSRCRCCGTTETRWGFSQPNPQFGDLTFQWLPKNSWLKSYIAIENGHL